MSRFAAGDSVRISDREEIRHHRVPVYAKGHTGVIERVCGPQGQPEQLAVGGSGEPRQTVYRIRLSQTALWPDYSGSDADALEIEIYEHWLEPQEEPTS